MKHHKEYGLSSLPMSKIVKWQVGTWLNLLFPKSKTDYQLKVIPLTSKDFERDDDFIVWLGHATFYIQVGGVRIITDPVLGSVPATKRYVNPPIATEALDVDIALVSHGHYDHFSLDSIKKLNLLKKRRSIVMPLNLGDYLPKGHNVKELDWYEKFEYNSEVTITALPASHWHRRGAFDFNKALWCSYLIQYKNKTIYFAGDTAFDGHFKEIQEHVQNLDIALMPIGAYEPREIMKTNHMNPDEAMQATETLEAKTMIPYHYGTFKLSDEPVGEPEEKIVALAQKTEVDVKVLAVGEIIEI